MILDLQSVTTKVAVHQLLQTELGFPDWYGYNWDAFWDCITAIVPMPVELRLVNWQAFANACPHDISILRQIAQEYEEEMPGKTIVLA